MGIRNSVYGYSQFTLWKSKNPADFWISKNVTGIINIHKSKYDGWMDDLQFNVLFNSISVISDDNERLCAMKPCLQVRRFHLKQGSNLGLLGHSASA